MLKNMVSYWGSFVGSLGIARGQKNTCVIYPGFTRMFSQTFSPALNRILSQLRVAFYSLSTPINNNNFSITLIIY
jgi:hypothetical protein